MAANYQRGAQRIAPDQPWQRLVYSGGLAQKLPPLRQLINARFGVPDRLAPSSEDTMVGLLALALRADGRANTVTAAIEAIQSS